NRGSLGAGFPSTRKLAFPASELFLLVLHLGVDSGELLLPCSHDSGVGLQVGLALRDVGLPFEEGLAELPESRLLSVGSRDLVIVLEVGRVEKHFVDVDHLLLPFYIGMPGPDGLPAGGTWAAEF